MTLLDIFLVGAGLAAGFLSFFSGTDSLYKLFIGLIIGFLVYALIASQVELTDALSPAVYNTYQSFLASNKTGVLSLALLAVPFLGIFFMLHPKLTYHSQVKSPSHLLLGLLLPVFLIGILAFLGSGSLLSENATWQRIFDFFTNSGIYRLFQTLPWAIFALLMFLIFYKSFFILLVAFLSWIWNTIILEFFKSWNEEKKRVKEKREGEREFEGE
ncbi:hypothetical protein N9J72_00195 [Candidatus Gracilibacteria bacterium]|nr:hypothetical protein [Candidatus Gracilibacteria bacterium]